MQAAMTKIKETWGGGGVRKKNIRFIVINASVNPTNLCAKNNSLTETGVV
jgi:hypothetical protein